MNDNQLNFCYFDCKYLTITEEEQRKFQGKYIPEHICKKYNKRVTHDKYDMLLVRLDCCKYREVDLNKKL
jgi:hypothetical protein